MTAANRSKGRNVMAVERSEHAARKPATPGAGLWGRRACPPGRGRAWTTPTGQCRELGARGWAAAPWAAGRAAGVPVGTTSRGCGEKTGFYFGRHVKPSGDFLQERPLGPV